MQDSKHIVPVCGLAVAVLAVATISVGCQTSVHRSSTDVNAQRSQAKLRSIGQAMAVYASYSNDQYPPSDQAFEILIDQGLIEPVLLVSPLEDGDGVSYILTGLTEISYRADLILAYEDPKHMADGVLVLFDDNHIEQLSHAEFEAMLAAQQARQNEP